MSMRFSRPLTWLLACVGVVSTSANATYYSAYHGFREEGIMLLVEFMNEPPYAGERARFGFAPFVDVVFDDKGRWVDFGRFVSQGDNVPGDESTYPEDRVSIHGYIELLDKDGNVVVRDSFPQGFTQPYVTGDYITEFTPQTAGRYAVVVSGRLKARDKNGKLVDFTFENERFVCKLIEKLHIWSDDGIPCLVDRKRPLRFLPSEPS